MSNNKVVRIPVQGEVNFPQIITDNTVASCAIMNLEQEILWLNKVAEADLIELLGERPKYLSAFLPADVLGHIDQVFEQVIARDDPLVFVTKSAFLLKDFEEHLYFFQMFKVPEYPDENGNPAIGQVVVKLDNMLDKCEEFICSYSRA